MKKVVLFLLLTVPSALFALDYYPGQDPKAYVTHIRLGYNLTYGIFEIEAKAASQFRIARLGEWNFGLLGAIEIFIHPTHGLGGYYPVDNLIGYFGTYLCATNLGGKNIDFILYPIVHESCHLVDGYDRGGTEEGYLYDDVKLISYEYGGFDVRWTTGGLRLTGGWIGYYYYGSNIEDRPRPLFARVHLGEDYAYPIRPRMSLAVSSDFALFYEDRVHTAVNLAAGVKWTNLALMLHYEHQYGLGQDYQTLQDRVGLEIAVGKEN